MKRLRRLALAAIPAAIAPGGSGCLAEAATAQLESDQYVIEGRVCGLAVDDVPTVWEAERVAQHARDCEEPINEARVVLERPKANPVTVTTDASGRFILAVAQGEVGSGASLLVDAEGHYGVRLPDVGPGRATLSRKRNSVLVLIPVQAGCERKASTPARKRQP